MFMKFDQSFMRFYQFYEILSVFFLDYISILTDYILFMFYEIISEIIIVVENKKLVYSILMFFMTSLKLQTR